MGYGIIPNYKSEDVLCQSECKHLDCRATREDFISNNKCRICGKELKIGDAFCYETEHGKYTKSHHRCLIE